MAAYTTTQSSPGLLDTLRNTWGSRGNAKPALGLDLERSLEDLHTQRPKKGFLRSVVASFCLAPAVHGERTNPKLTDGLTDDEEDIDAASEATTEVSPPLSLRYTGLGQPWNMKREAAFRARLEKCRRNGAVLVLLRHGESEWNAKDQFTGWADVGMTDEGRKQAVNAGHRLAASGVRRFDDLHSSALKRTVDTLSVVLEALSGASLPKGPRGTVVVEVTIGVDAECLLEIGAREPTTGRHIVARMVTRHTTEELRTRLGLPPTPSHDTVTALLSG